MSLVGVISSNAEVNGLIEEQFAVKNRKEYRLRFASSIADIMDLLNFNLPEIVILNMTDFGIDHQELFSAMKSDSWLHNFGIICIYDKTLMEENHILEKHKELNILSIMDYKKLPGNIYKNVRIIDQNRQIIFQWDLADKLTAGVSGSFTIDNDPLVIPVYTGLVVTAIAQRGYIAPEAKINLQIGLNELIINGMEHGNCKINYEEKTAYLHNGLSLFELVAEKMRDPQVAKTNITFDYEITPTSSEFRITDCGEGFNVKEYMEKVKNADKEALHGRGILMARGLAKKLSYNTKGNTAKLLIMHKESVTRDAPAGFGDQEHISVSRDKIVFSEGEVSDHLYYISSGNFSVFHANKLVGNLTPADIFMGEMSFLLNNKRSATVRAETPGKLVKISRKAFVSVAKKYPHYGMFLSKLLARKLQRSNAKNARTQELLTLAT